ncbi:MAG: apolipoprotein N-acyltransferase [Endomicrobium sp.]|jgi:apolipoprotein N-acyltransferase|nr:apolipoprotein N-acyltransferase [Endomicrobium sp.]
MKNRLIYKDFALCTLTGFFSSLSFQRLNLFFIVWISFVPMIFVLKKSKLVKSFFYSFWSGFVFNAFGIYWLVYTIYFNTGCFIQSIIAPCILWIYLALYWGIWGLSLNLLVSSNSFKKNIFYSNILLSFFASCIWVLIEYIRTYLFTGFPWLLIGYSQFNFIEIIQIAEFVGVYGVSFLVMFCNLCIYFWIFEKNKNLKKNNLYLFVVLLIVFGFLIFGITRINKFKSLNVKKFTVAVVQPNIDQYKKWDPRYFDSIFSNLSRYAFKISKFKIDLVIWPESVFAGCINKDKFIYDKIKQITKIAGGLNIVGSLYKDKTNNKCFNVVSAFENGNYINMHKKNHLIIFGEFVPFKFIFSNFFNALDNNGDLTKGNDVNIFNNNKMLVGSTICSENFLPNISRKLASFGAEVFTNHTNDSWFFDTSAPYQHFAMNVFRAIENRKQVIISANSGISGIIDTSGVIIKKTPSFKGVLFIDYFFQNDFKTFYTKYGDLFVFICLVSIFCLAFIELVKKIIVCL